MLLPRLLPRLALALMLACPCLRAKPPLLERRQPLLARPLAAQPVG
jgi:hypothetical protein